NFARPGGRHSAIDVGDVNDDGINDILVGSSDNYAYIFQEANCIIEFNDSTNADMTWNYTTKLWEYERTFDIYQDYSYNVTCSKGGYETQTTTNNEIKVDAAPFFRTLTITPIIAYTNDTLQCIFNITHSEQSTLNITAIWKKDNIDIQNITIIDYEQGTEYTLNLTPKYTYHNNNITCNITASDGRYNITNTTTTQINNYPTTLSINNTNASAGQIIKFTANYSSEKIGDITPFVWNSSDFDQYNNTYTVRFIDLNSDGFANDLIGGGADTSTDDMLIAIYNNGTQAWNLTNLNTFYNIETADLDGDNIINDILVKYEQYVIRRINSNSTTNWSASVTGSSNNHIGIVADIDSDGKKDVVFATAEAGTGGYFLYKGDGTQIWNTTGQCSNAVNFALGDFDRDGKEDDIAFMDWAMCGIGLYLGISVFDNEKNLLFNTTDLGDFNSWPLSVQAIDLNKNGLKDEIIIGYGNTGTMSVFSWNGTYNATYSTTNSIYNNTLNSPITVITAYDYDDDNFSNEFVLGVRDNHIISYNKTTSLWNVSIDRPGIALSLKMGDISDDEKQEIMVGTNTSQFMILSKKGEVIFNYSNGFGKIGANPWGGKSDGIDVGDFNNDGINDVAVSYVQGYFFVYQEVSCIIEFNDSITANMTYNKTSGLWEYSRTFNDGGNYTYNVTCSKGGYETKTNTTQDYVIPNTPPSITEPTINPTIAYTNSTLECSAIAIDNEQTNLNITFFWYKDGVLNTTAIMQTTNNSLTTNSLTQGLQNKNETWNCTVNSYDGLGYSDNKSKSITINNTIPSIPILEYPLNNDTLFTNRTPRFNWTTSIDADNDIINYTIEVSLSSDFSSIIINTTTTNNYYIQTTEFDFATYFWRVRPFDGQNYGEYSNISNFTLVKSTDIILINSTINFGILDNSVIDDTTDNNPYPFILRNNGNSEANITINATQELFITQPLNTSYFQFLVNYSEPNSFDYANSQTTWFNIPNFVYKIIALFNHTDSNDEARIDILINVPSNEPPGDKNTTIIFEASPT
ncbi:MAG: VCBS repeat-containing protein, partial [Candidatus Woesearchaeota archaeon]